MTNSPFLYQYPDPLPSLYPHLVAKGCMGAIWQAITGLTGACGGCLFGKPNSGRAFSIGSMLQAQSATHRAAAAYGVYCSWVAAVS